MTLVMIRHGATKSNQEHRYLGRTDEPLSTDGKRELAEYVKLHAYPDVDCLFSSPMKRCVQTAGILYPAMEPVCIAEWTEMDFGAFEGKNYMELKNDARYQRWIDSDGTLPFPEGESRENFILRCERGFRKMTGKLMQMEDTIKPKSIGMIVHGGTIMALLSSHNGSAYFDYQVATGRGYLCTIDSWDNMPRVILQAKL